MSKDRIIGNAYKELKVKIKRYAKRDKPVLLIGERGTGKEEFAQYYKNCSSRNISNMRDLNCAAVARQLIDSELFGHVKGSFTGAVNKRSGLLASCNNGILFLDELGDASLRFQASILRITQGLNYRPVGSDEQISSYETVIIAATNKPKSIRQDLKDRFHIFHIPPLQYIDIPRLAEKFCGGKIKQKYMDELMNRSYPGNIRELLRICEKYVVEIGKDLFADHRDYELYDTVYIEYERWSKEHAIWHAYIQPLLDRYKLNYKYRYEFHPEKGSLNVIMENINFLPDEPMVDEDGNCAESTPNEVYFRRIIEGTIIKENLSHALECCYSYKNLSWLLENIRMLVEFNKKSRTFSNLSKGVNIPFSHFLQLPLKEARVEFEKHYVQTHLRNSSSRDETIENMGGKVTKSNLKRLIGKHKIVI